ncbi:MAG: Npt1/Npt2 family nucleotide transporter [Kangiellaceae bacterium]|jgi:AAA family ATP:ADP antiporter|nr:Npt1/Npt2 family nucleotide transporter [Kangiellaceae bacterium]
MTYLSELIKKRLLLSKQESLIVAFGASYFFLLLTAYYILRPIRETMGISRSATDLPSIFLGTMITLLAISPLIGALVSKFHRTKFIPIFYHFVSACLIVFFALLITVNKSHLFYVGIGFYVWLSVINMLLISLFWGFMADGIGFSRSKKLFPSLAIGGTIGAIFGSSIAQIFIDILGQNYLLLVPILFLQAAVVIMKKLDGLFYKYQSSEQSSKPHANTPSQATDESPGNQPSTKWQQWISGIRYTMSSPYLLAIAGYIFFYGLTSTFLYFQQGILVAEAASTNSDRTKIFANIDFWANTLTLLLQLFISRQFLKRFSLSTILIGLPLFTMGGFAALAAAPTLAVLVVFQSLRRSLNYGLFKPAREILFTLIPSEQKYKAKSFVDSFIYRGGDAVGALSQKALNSFSFGIGAVSLIVIPVAGAWSLLALFLGRHAESKHAETSVSTE